MNKNQRLQMIEEALDGLKMGQAVDLEEEWRKHFLVRLMGRAARNGYSYGEMKATFASSICEHCLEDAWSDAHKRQLKVDAYAVWRKSLGDGNYIAMKILEIGDGIQPSTAHDLEETRDRDDDCLGL